MRSEPRLRIDSTNLLDVAIGAAGVTRGAVLELSARLNALREKVHAWRSGTNASFLGLPFAPDVEALRDRGQAIARGFRQTILFGIGGSSLGGEMLVNALGRRPDHALFFYDNIDPTTLAPLESTRWDQTLLLVVSKSGNTAETLHQFLSVLPDLEQQLGAKRLREHVLVVTENRDGALCQVAQQLGLEIIMHPPVGGRYSVLSVVGLLPAAIAGIDVDSLLQGACTMAERCSMPDMEENPAFWNGALQYLHAVRGRGLSVQMAYADRLRTVTMWYRQLWAESLGKRDADGNHRGLTPIAAHGVTDQHSQLQLYLDGPDDKQFTFLTSPDLADRGMRVPQRFESFDAIRPLTGHRSGKLFAAEFEATRATLTRHGRPNRTLMLGLDDAAALGELIILLEMETVVVAELLGIDPFDQPAVEEGKVLAREYLMKR